MNKFVCFSSKCSYKIPKKVELEDTHKEFWHSELNKSYQLTNIRDLIKLQEILATELNIIVDRVKASKFELLSVFFKLKLNYLITSYQTNLGNITISNSKIKFS